MRTRSRYGHRPALDGLRGLAITTFVAYHLGVPGLPGTWVNVNLFLVLSGFLIVRLLLEERVEGGRLDVLAFYRRRARRLLPALGVLLAVLAGYGLLAAPAAVRRGLGGDLLATAGYVMNWRLVLREDAYFEQTGTPSLLRHAWTLAVEEQFYLLAPLLVLALVALLRSRRAQVGVLLALAAASAAWAAVVGVDTARARAHLYYGTDTRAQALLVGAALGVALGLRPDGSPPRRLPRGVVAALGWAGLAATLAWYPAAEPFTPWIVLRGGLLLSCLGAAAVVLAAADPRPSLLATVLGWAPLAYLGRLSYGIYLWHWPVALWLRSAGLAGGALVAAGGTTTLLLAAASHHLVERPVLRGGLRALLPGRGTVVLAAASLALLVAAAAGIERLAGPAPAVAARDSVRAPVVPLVPGDVPYRPGPRPVRAAVVGDSVPYLLARGLPTGRYPDLHLTNLAVPGCDLIDAPALGPGIASAESGDCTAAKDALSARLRAAGAESVVIFPSSLMPLQHRLPDGTEVGVGDPRYETLVLGALERIRADAARAGTRRLQVVTLPCRDPARAPADLEAYLRSRPRLRSAVADPVGLNDVLRRWAARHGAGVIDLYAELCSRGFEPERHGVELYTDGIHFSPAATPMLWTWLAPRVRDAAAR